MKYIFFGTPRFAEIVLAGLIADIGAPIAVVTNPDRPAGRKKVITPPPVKLLAIRTSPDIDIIQSEALDDAFLKRLAALEPDLFVVAAFAKIIPAAALPIPRHGAIGVHPSLLPHYRGASPIQSAILDGATATGTTIYTMDEKMDHGPILAQASVGPAAAPYPALEATLAKLGATLVAQAMQAVMAGTATPRPQDETQATYTQKFKTEDAFIAPEDLAAARAGTSPDTASAILRKIYAFTPEPGAWTLQDGKRMKLLDATLTGGRLILRETQRDGEKPKTAP